MGETGRSHPRRWAILAVICSSLLVVVIDVTVLHVAAPAISEDLDPTALQLLWIIDVYPLVAAPLLVTSGVLGDRLGRKRILLAGMVLFGLASIGATFAPTAEALIAARAVLGVAGAMIMPPTMSIIRDVFRDRDERVRAVGIWSAVSAGGAAIGPLIGGFLVEHFWWGAVFLINVPIVLGILPVAIRLLPESRAAEPPPWDGLAMAATVIGILGLAFGLKEGARYGFAEPEVLLSLLVAFGSLAWFTRRQLRAPHPLLDVRLFARRDFTVAVGCVLLSMFGLVGIEFFGAQYLQLVLGLEPLDAALRLLPLMLSTLAGGLLAARVLRWLGTRWTISLGLAGTGIGLVPMLFLGLADQYLLLWPAFLVIGFTLEIALVAANDVIISSVPADEAGQAAAIEETAYELGGGFGVAVLGSILAIVYTNQIESIKGVGGPGIADAEESLSRALEVAARMSDDVAGSLIETAKLAFMSGYHTAIAVSIALVGVSAGIAAVLLRPRRESTQG
ncbi:MAG: MFS transporter [Solirubrobacterales bacterium]|nr:MFS transporter [Solirubrobacterales bacterium]